MKCGRRGSGCGGCHHALLQWVGVQVRAMRDLESYKLRVVCYVLCGCEAMWLYGFEGVKTEAKTVYMR